jgi:putrescine transport system substrate-binding protein
LNFLLQPEISAKITNFNYYPNAVEKSKEFIQPEILFDPIIYPSAESLKKAETIYPLSEKGEALYTETWQRFLDAP